MAPQPAQGSLRAPNPIWQPTKLVSYGLFALFLPVCFQTWDHLGDLAGTLSNLPCSQLHWSLVRRLHHKKYHNMIGNFIRHPVLSRFSPRHSYWKTQHHCHRFQVDAVHFNGQGTPVWRLLTAKHSRQRDHMHIVELHGSSFTGTSEVTYERLVFIASVIPLGSAPCATSPPTAWRVQHTALHVANQHTIIHFLYPQNSSPPQNSANNEACKLMAVWLV